ncbi:MAG: carbonate dehydratase [Proteobacteria bacterium]|nr:MAG: carbonate dehydratase [Pseudomonadota bacterium]
MKKLPELFERNKAWSAKVKQQDPEFFQKLSQQQSPQFLWIGCSDSRVPANQIVGLLPGEIFVHRNVANLVVHTDFNCLSVIQYAVAVLKVKHIIVCGHYGCGGVQAALRGSNLGLIDNWLRHIKDISRKYEALLAGIGDQPQQLRRLCELNVLEQAFNVCNTTIVHKAWEAGQELSVHSWIYGVESGLLQDLKFCVSARQEIQDVFDAAIGNLKA